MLMVITSPTTMIPATFDFIGGIVGAADSAGDYVGDVREEQERLDLEEQVRADVEADVRRELCAEGITEGSVCAEALTEPPKGDSENSLGTLHPDQLLPDPETVWNTLHDTENHIADELDAADLRPDHNKQEAGQ
ncbi:MAG: hypothetical protein AAF962_18155 [Actinomycetota bacterium]